MDKYTGAYISRQIGPSVDIQNSNRFLLSVRKFIGKNS